MILRALASASGPTFEYLTRSTAQLQGDRVRNAIWEIPKASGKFRKGRLL